MKICPRLFFAVITLCVAVLYSGYACAGQKEVLQQGRELPAFKIFKPLAEFEEPLHADMHEIFLAVAGGVHYEPYRGILRGAAGTARTGSGNAADQAMLLADLLYEAGYQVRFARGRLEGENVNILLRGMYPPKLPSLTALDPETQSFDTARDIELQEIVRDHIWVEVFQGDDWYPLDASFPRARPGEAYATAEEHFEQPPPELFQRVRIELREQTREEDSRIVGGIEGTVEELGLLPVSLVIRSVPQVSADEEPDTGGGAVGMFGGMGGALGGRKAPEKGQEEEDDPEVLGTMLRRHFNLNGERMEMGSTFVDREEAVADYLKREWLEITLKAPGTDPKSVVRTLYPVGRETLTGGPPEDRIYSINILPGPLSAEWMRARAREADAGLDLSAMENELSSLTGKSGTEADKAAVRIGAISEKVGTAAGRLVAMQFAAHSDALTFKAARAHGIRPVWARPRIIITSAETSEHDRKDYEATFSLDLRLNKVEAYPYPGLVSGTAYFFRHARGLNDTALEAEIVSRITGEDEPVNVFPLMNTALGNNIPMYVLTPEDSSARESLKELPERCEAMILNTLEQGRHVIIPERAVLLAGKERWGWWDFDSETGDIIGVMETGEHQAMVEYKLGLDRVGLNDKTGYVIGSMIGTTVTLFTVSALILEYGGTTPEMIAAVKDLLKSSMCSFCFTGAEASESVEVSVSASAGCLEWKKSLKADVGVGATVKFCENYKKGFECASGMLLAGMEGRSVLEAGGGISLEHASEMDFTCAP